MERMRFQEPDVPKTDYTGSKAGCYLSTVAGALLAILAVILAIGVGIVVFFASSSTTRPCQCLFASDNGPVVAKQTKNPVEIWDQCLNISAAKNECEYTNVHIK